MTDSQFFIFMMIVAAGILFIAAWAIRIVEQQSRQLVSDIYKDYIKLSDERRRLILFLGYNKYDGDLAIEVKNIIARWSITLEENRRQIGNYCRAIISLNEDVKALQNHLNDIKSEK